MNELYPLKFKPILKDKIWGGSRLKTILNKTEASDRTGESWEISGIKGNVSVVADGFLKGNDLLELVEVYMGDLVGDKVFDVFGNEFPLLIKYIDANDKLSLQVHPDDELAMNRHGTSGKTEMWYVIHAEEDAEIISGFNHKIDSKLFQTYLMNNNVIDILHKERVFTGDVFFIPSGRVHAINPGILLAEIQQSSDITYRIFDWNRVDENGKLRPLHTRLAMEAIDFNPAPDAKIEYEREMNKSIKIAECEYFTTNLIQFENMVEKDFNLIDSFIIYLCTEGEVDILSASDNRTRLCKGDTVLIPAYLKEIMMVPVKKSTLLEVYIK